MRSLFVVLFLASLPAFAETWMVGTVASYHYGTDKKYEQQNWGVGIEQDIARNLRIAGGMYRNSNRRDSIYFGLSWAPAHFGNWHLGLAALFIGGYETTKQPELVKAAFPVVSYESKGWGINIPIIPAVNDNPGAVGIQLKVRW